MPHEITLWTVPLLGILAAVAWYASVRPPPEKIRRTLRDAALGVVVAGTIVFGLRWAWGPRVPVFVPPEESAAPGFMLNMAAGYGEEILFRIVLLPILFLALASHAPRPLALVIAVLVTAVGFALLHEPASASFSRTLFTTRFLLPGCFMSTAALTRSPTFIVVAHCTAHVAVPLAFAG